MTFLVFIVSWMVLIFVGIPIAVSMISRGTGIPALRHPRSP
jgi:hypothetical protein